jgi:hypothetical protein
MALEIDEMNAVSTKYFDDKMTSQVYDSHPFFKKLRADEKVSISGGLKIQIPIRYQKLEHAELADWDDEFVFRSKKTRTALELEWIPMKATTMLGWEERIKNRGKSEIVDLARDRAKELKEDMIDLLATRFVGQSSTGSEDTSVPASLDLIIDSGLTYGGIAVADASEWAAQEDSSTTTLALSGSGSLGALVTDATFGGHGPTMHLTTADLWNAYEALLDPQKRYEDSEMAGYGFQNLTFRTKPVMHDNYVAAKHWFGIDMDAFELVVQEGEDVNVSKWMGLEPQYPKAIGKYVTFVGNLGCRRRKTNLKFTALEG